MTCSSWNCSHRSHRHHTSHAYPSNHTHTGALMSERDKPRQVAMAMVDTVARVCSTLLFRISLSSRNLILFIFRCSKSFNQRANQQTASFRRAAVGAQSTESSSKTKQAETENHNQFDHNNIIGVILRKDDFISVFNNNDQWLQSVIEFNKNENEKSLLFLCVETVFSVFQRALLPIPEE